MGQTNSYEVYSLDSQEELSAFSTEFNQEEYSPEKKIRAWGRLGDINRNMLNLQNPQGQIINAALNTDDYWQRMLSDVARFTSDEKGLDVPSAQTADTVGTDRSSTQALTLADLSDRQVRILNERIQVANYDINNDRFIQYCQGQLGERAQFSSNLSFKEFEEIILQHAKSSLYQRSEGAIDAQGLLKEMLERRAAGEDFFTRLKALKDFDSNETFAKLKDSHSPSDNWHHIARYYDRLADFYEILAGPVESVDDIDDRKLSQVMRFFDTHQSAEQSYYVSAGLYGVFQSQDSVAKSLTLSLNKQAEMSLAMQYMKMSVVQAGQTQSTFVKKHQIMQGTVGGKKQTEPKLAKMNTEMCSHEGKLYQHTFDSQEALRGAWDEYVAKKTAEYRYDPLLVHVVQATRAPDEQSFQVSHNVLALHADTPNMSEAATQAKNAFRSKLVGNKEASDIVNAKSEEKAPQKKAGILRRIWYVISGRQPRDYHGTSLFKLAMNMLNKKAPGSKA